MLASSRRIGGVLLDGTGSEAVWAEAAPGMMRPQAPGSVPQPSAAHGEACTVPNQDTGVEDFFGRMGRLRGRLAAFRSSGECVQTAAGGTLGEGAATSLARKRPAWATCLGQRQQGSECGWGQPSRGGRDASPNASVRCAWGNVQLPAGPPSPRCSPLLRAVSSCYITTSCYTISHFRLPGRAAALCYSGSTVKKTLSVSSLRKRKDAMWTPFITRKRPVPRGNTEPYRSIGWVTAPAPFPTSEMGRDSQRDH